MSKDGDLTLGTPLPAVDPAPKKGASKPAFTAEEQRQVLAYQMTAVVSALTDEGQFNKLVEALGKAVKENDFSALNNFGILVNTREDLDKWFPGCFNSKGEPSHKDIIWNLLTYYLGEPGNPDKIGLDTEYAAIADTKDPENALHFEQRMVLYYLMLEFENALPQNFKALKSVWDNTKNNYADRDGRPTAAIVHQFISEQSKNKADVMELFKNGSFNGRLRIQDANYSVQDITHMKRRELTIINFALSTEEMTKMMKQFQGGGGKEFIIERDGELKTIENRFADVQFKLDGKTYGMLLIPKTINLASGDKEMLIEHKVELDGKGNPVGEPSLITHGDHLRAEMTGDYKGCSSLAGAVVQVYEEMNNAIKPKKDEGERTAVEAAVKTSPKKAVAKAEVISCAEKLDALMKTMAGAPAPSSLSVSGTPPAPTPAKSPAFRALMNSADAVIKDIRKLKDSPDDRAVDKIVLAVRIKDLIQEAKKIGDPAFGASPDEQKQAKGLISSFEELDRAIRKIPDEPKAASGVKATMTSSVKDRAVAFDTEFKSTRRFTP